MVPVMEMKEGDLNLLKSMKFRYLAVHADYLNAMARINMKKLLTGLFRSVKEYSDDNIFFYEFEPLLSEEIFQSLMMTISPGSPRLH